MLKCASNSARRGRLAATGAGHRSAADTEPARELREALRFAFDDPVADLTILERVIGQLTHSLADKLTDSHLAAHAPFTTGIERRQ